MLWLLSLFMLDTDFQKIYIDSGSDLDPTDSRKITMWLINVYRNLRRFCMQILNKLWIELIFLISCEEQ